MGGNCFDQELQVIMDTAHLCQRSHCVESLSFTLFFIELILYFHSKLNSFSSLFSGNYQNCSWQPGQSPTLLQRPLHRLPLYLLRLLILYLRTIVMIKMQVRCILLTVATR